MSRLIDADALRAWFNGHDPLDEVPTEFIIGIIDEQPTINPVAEALKILPEKETVNKNSYEYYKRLAEDRGKNVMNLSAALEKILNERQWIPVSERLPDPDTWVLVSRDDDVTIMAVTEHGEWYFTDGDFTHGKIDAWMPLPEPWREEE